MTDNFAWMYHTVYEPPYRDTRKRKTYLRRTAYAVAGVVMALAAWQAWGWLWAL